MENGLSANFHTQKQRAGYPKIPGICPVLSLNLRADFRPVAEGEHHPAIRIDRCVIHKPVEQLLVEVKTLDDTVSMQAGEGISINKNVVHFVRRMGEWQEKSLSLLCRLSELE